MKISSLGAVMQLAYVPPDFDQAVQFWTRTMGVGPFFLLPHIKIPAVWYRGSKTQLDFSLALAYWNDMQIELIRAHDATPSVFTDWTRRGGDGLHHVCVCVEDMMRAKEVCRDAGAEVVQEFQLDGGAAIYVDTGGGPGTLLEILQAPSAIQDFFGVVRAASWGWNGQEPLRTLS